MINMNQVVTNIEEEKSSRRKKEKLRDGEDLRRKPPPCFFHSNLCQPRDSHRSLFISNFTDSKVIYAKVNQFNCKEDTMGQYDDEEDAKCKYTV